MVVINEPMVQPWICHDNKTYYYDDYNNVVYDPDTGDVAGSIVDGQIRLETNVVPETNIEPIKYSHDRVTVHSQDLLADLVAFASQFTDPYSINNDSINNDSLISMAKQYCWERM